MHLFGKPAALRALILGLTVWGGAALGAQAPVGSTIAFPESPAIGRTEHLPAALEDAMASVIAPEAPANRRDVLIKTMERYGDMTYVPYVWAGGAIGNRKSCMDCRACVEAKPRLKVERRLKACDACKECGVDCSHFANKVLTDAGFSYPYVDTRGMTRSSRAELRKKYNLVDMGNDARKALPGDLLLFKHHVVMVFDAYGDGMGDILHVSRSIKKKGTGGIEVVRGQDLGKFRGRLLKILRHGVLHDAPSDKPARGRDALPTPDEVSRHRLVV